MIRKFAISAAKILGIVTLLALANVANAQESEAVVVAEMQQGNPDAKVTVIEYASFTCPHCANFHKDQYQELKTNYIDTGMINFVYREVYFDRFGLWSSMVARCDETKFFGISDLLYKGQSEWTKGTPAEIADNLRKIGRVAGLSEDQLTACLSDADKATGLYGWYKENAETDGITSTPSFIINGEKSPNLSYAEFAAVLDEKLAE
ncbi:MAG: DsbA family protein [Paracoccaceae bacterium]|nr:DsbA family protein [Paracoccaceae bacterium]